MYSGHILLSINNQLIVDQNNTITSAGKTHIADLLKYQPNEAIALSEAPMLSIAIGTGMPSSTALGAEISRRGIRKTRAGAIITLIGHWDIDDQLSGSITEAGIFNTGTSGGTMLASTIFATITKQKNDALDITWTISVL